MAELRLPSGHIAIIDDVDLPLTHGYRWHADKRKNTIYVRGRKIGFYRSGVYLHKVLTGADNTDHKDGNGLNNRRSNLRVCTQQQNCLNAGKKRRGKRFKGVYFREDRQKWWAQLYVGGRSFFGGHHDTEESAALAYNNLAREHHGDFARLNEVRGN